MKITSNRPHSLLSKTFDLTYGFFWGVLALPLILKRATDFATIPKEQNYKTTNLSEVQDLTLIMDTYGSDKGSLNGYTKYYQEILSNKAITIRNVLEIGIGTNDPNLLSNMGELGIPGASLRGWRDYAPNALIYGADIDVRILFVENRIKTFYVDQLKRKSLSELVSSLNTNLDLIVIDGLHTPRADLNSLLILLPTMSQNGDFIIEDIGEHAYKYFWPIIAKRIAPYCTMTFQRSSIGRFLHIKFSSQSRAE